MSDFNRYLAKEGLTLPESRALTASANRYMAQPDTISQPQQHDGTQMWNPSIQDYAEFGLGFTPFGVAVDAKDVYKGYQAGSPMLLGLGAIGLVPGIGDALKKGGKNIARRFISDGSGNAVTFYHGTDNLFDKFDKDKIGSNFGLDSEGFFFTTDKGSANRSRSSHPNKPIYQYTDEDRALASGGYIREANIYEDDFLNISDIEDFDYRDGLGPIGLFDSNRDKIISKMNELGKKGIKINSEGSTMAMVLDPSGVVLTK